jgi:aminoglycoside phosphotransferase (APT) family kinase protein
MTMNETELTDVLREWLPGGDRLEAVVRLGVGHSNQTYLLQGLDRILRLPPSGPGVLPTYDMGREHAVLAALHGTPGAPPVPQVYELCTDPDVLGAPFFVMERAPGDTFEHPEVPAWLADGSPETRRHTCEQWLHAIAALHCLPATALPLDPVSPLSDAMGWLITAEKVGAPPHLVELLDGLVNDPPPQSGAPTPVHGDPHLANCLWRDGKLTSLIDWELAFVGDPLADLGWMAAYFADEPFVPPTAGFDLPGWFSRTDLINDWEQATGRSADGVRRHETLAMAKIATIFATGARLLETGASNDPRLATWAEWLPGYLALIEYRASQPDRL